MKSRSGSLTAAAVLAILSLAAARAGAQEYSKQETITPNLPQIPGAVGITTTTKDLYVDIGIGFDLTWKVWTLLNEPVVDSTVAWSLTGAVVKTAGFLKAEKGVSGRPVPKEVAAKIRVYDVVFLLGLSYEGLGSASCNLSIDPGVLSKPYLGPLADFRRLNAESRKSFFSFNVPGSPDWSKLFWSDDLINSYAANEAREIIRKGFTSIRPRIWSAKVDLGPVKEWLLGLERQAIDRLKSELSKREAVLAAKEAERKKAEADDFWDTPASADSTADVAERQAIARDKAAVQAADAAWAAELANLAEERKAVDARIEARTAELKLRPKPGEGPKGELSRFVVDGKVGIKDSTGRVIVPAEYYSLKLPACEGMVAVNEYTTRKYGFVDLSGRVTVPCRYDAVQDFSEGLAAVSLGGKWGYVDRNGNVVIDPQFVNAYGFSQGLAGVSAMMVISRAGSGLYKPEVLTSLENWNTHGFINGRGVQVIPPRYWAVGRFKQNGCATVFRVVGFRGEHQTTYSDGSVGRYFGYRLERLEINSRGEQVGAAVTEDRDLSWVRGFSGSGYEAPNLPDIP